MTQKNNPIGIFDSGMGGLTVLRALQDKCPNESFIYLGDTARLPYGTKSPDTVRQYALQMANLLFHRGIKLLVIACNTASTTALTFLKEQFPSLPIVGVAEPGAYAACQATKNNHVAVLATETTVESNCYRDFIHAINPDIQVQQLACALFVALAEEGWIDTKVTDATVEQYLSQIMHQPVSPDTIVLGCTHFPVLKNAIKKQCDDNVNVIDSALTTANIVFDILSETDLHSENNNTSSTHFLVTDCPHRFIHRGEIFLNKKINANAVELIHHDDLLNSEQNREPN